MGISSEKIAEQHLASVENYIILDRNYRCPLGEIDLVAMDGNTLVFVEVRSSSSPYPDLAGESVGFRKQKKLRQLASIYLNEKKIPHFRCRFDVVILLMDKERKTAREIGLYKNAF